MLGAILTGAKMLLGGSNGANNIAKAASFIGEQYDKSQFTEEELADAHKAQMDGFREWFGQTVNENTERSITRRGIALLIIRLSVVLTVFSMVAFKLDREWADYGLEWFKLWWPLTAGVGVFFFGTHLARNFTGKK